MVTDLVNGQEARAPVAVGKRGLQLNSLDEMWRFATAVAKSGLAPKGMERPETVLVAMQLGAELGLSPMSALQNIGVINGRPGIYGDAALALVRASGLCENYAQSIEGEGDKRQAVVTSKRHGCEPIETTFSVKDAKQAKLWGKDGPWTQYPDRMLLWRARGFNLRDNFGDVLKGLRTTEELQDIAAASRSMEVLPESPPPDPERLRKLLGEGHQPDPEGDVAAQAPAREPGDEDEGDLYREEKPAAPAHVKERR